MLTQEQIIRLQDIGLAACHYGTVSEARKIFDGLLKLRPDNTTALVGRAMSHIVVNDFSAAEEILQKQVLSNHPDDAEAETLLGLCCVLNGNPDGARDLLRNGEARQTPSGQVARDLLAGLVLHKF